MQRNAFLDGVLEGISSISLLFTQITPADIDHVWRTSFPYQKKTRIGSPADDLANIKGDFTRAIRAVESESRMRK